MYAYRCQRYRPNVWTPCSFSVEGVHSPDELADVIDAHERHAHGAPPDPGGRE